MGPKALSSDVEIDFREFDAGNAQVRALSQHLKPHSRHGTSEPKIFISHGLFAYDELSVIYGAPGSTKSALAIDIACRAAVGMDWNGEYTAPIVGVLYVAAERAAQVRRRAEAFCRHHGLEPLDNLVVYVGPIDLVKDRGLLAAVTMAAAEMVPGGVIDLVVIDILAAAMSASDSSPDAMAAAVSTLSRTQRVLREELGEVPHIMLLHHTPANGEARLRGGGQLLGAADITVHVSQKRGVATARVDKNNDSPDRPSLTYELESVTIYEDEVRGIITAPVVVPLQYGAAVKGGGAKPSRAHRDAVAVLRSALQANDNQPVTEEQWRTVVYGTAGDIGPAGRRARFRRHREILEAGLALENEGRFSLPGA